MTPGRVERCVFRSEAPVEPAVKAAVAPVEPAIEPAVAPVEPAIEPAVATVKTPETPVLNLLGYVREGFLGTRAGDWGGGSRRPAEKPNSTGNESRYHKVSHHSLHGSYNETTVSSLSLGKAASSWSEQRLMRKGSSLTERFV
jgi:hypothetical protein